MKQVTAENYESWGRKNLEQHAADLTNKILELRDEISELRRLLSLKQQRIQSHSPAFERVGREFPEDDGC